MTENKNSEVVTKEAKETVKNVKRLLVTVKKRTNTETGELFNGYKAYTKKNRVYDLRFGRNVPEEIRPQATSYVYVEKEDMNLETKNRNYPILWVHDVVGVEELEPRENNLDDMFEDAEIEVEDDPFNQPEETEEEENLEE